MHNSIIFRTFGADKPGKYIEKTVNSPTVELEILQLHLASPLRILILVQFGSSETFLPFEIVLHTHTSPVTLIDGKNIQIA